MKMMSFEMKLVFFLWFFQQKISQSVMPCHLPSTAESLSHPALAAAGPTWL